MLVEFLSICTFANFWCQKQSLNDSAGQHTFIVFKYFLQINKKIYWKNNYGPLHVVELHVV